MSMASSSSSPPTGTRPECPKRPGQTSRQPRQTKRLVCRQAVGADVPPRAGSDPQPVPRRDWVSWPRPRSGRTAPAPDGPRDARLARRCAKTRQQQLNPSSGLDDEVSKYLGKGFAVGNQPNRVGALCRTSGTRCRSCGDCVRRVPWGADACTARWARTVSLTPDPSPDWEGVKTRPGRPRVRHHLRTQYLGAALLAQYRLQQYTVGTFHTETSTEEPRWGPG